MRVLITCLFPVITLLCSCSQVDTNIVEDNCTQEFIKGRGVEGRKLGIYRMCVPRHWIRHDPLPDDLVTDTTKSLCEFIINDPDGIIKIAVHNFPADTLDMRIPPQAQVARWKTQIEEYDGINSYTQPIAFGGFSGILFVGIGSKMVIAAALQLSPQHFRNLAGKEQMKADVTIKAVGPTHTMKKHQDEIINAIYTFGLVDEIPHPR